MKMKYTLPALVLVLSLTACSQKPTLADMKTDSQKVSAALGFGGLRILPAAPELINLDQFTTGTKLSLDEAKSISQSPSDAQKSELLGYAAEEQMKKHFGDLSLDPKAYIVGYDEALSIEKLMKDVGQLAQQNQQKATAENLSKGAAYLEAFAKEAGVVRLPSGLEYKVDKMGAGPKPKSTDTVTVNYEGSLIDGKVFDSSYQRGRPLTFPVSGVIKGWTEVLQLMPVGSTWTVVIPSSLAYGEAGAGGLIPPNSVLKFKIELLGIEKGVK